MKKIIIFLFLLFFIKVFPENLLQNSDFENWNDNYHPLNWFPDSLSVDTFYVEKSTNFYSGNYSLKANVFTKTQQKTDIVSEFISVLPNKVYRIKSYLLDNDQYLYAKIYLNHYDTSHTFISNNFTLDSVGNSTQWQYFPETLITTPTNCYYVKVGFRFYDLAGFPGSGTIYIDSAYFGDTLTQSTSPVISNVSHTQYGTNLIVSADITDDIQVITDSLYYRKNYSNWIQIFHDSLQVSKRFFTIPIDSNEIIEYYIIAKDNDNNRTVSSIYSFSITTKSKIKKILFDYTKNQTAGNADWVIDRDYPQPVPLDPTIETDWDGAISSWGFELDTAHIYNPATTESIFFEVYTLPPDSSIRYNSTSPMDLKNFDLFIVCEPQNPFTTDEKNNIFNYILNGGSLFMVADHVSSDRDNDGWDSPEIWQDFGSDSFGIHFQQVGEGSNNSSDSTNYYSSANDTITDGPFGNVTGYFYFHAGTMISQSSKSTQIAILEGTQYSFLTIARYGKGKVAGCGDSSPFDDGTGNTSDNLYDGWNEGVSRKLILNTTYWLVIDSTDAVQGLNETFYSCAQKSDTLFFNINLTPYFTYKTVKLYKKIFSDYTLIDFRNVNGNIVTLKDKNLKTKSEYKIELIKNNGSVEKYFIEFSPSTYENKISFDMLKNVITFSNFNEMSYKIIDLSGKTVINGKTKNQINLNNLKNGVYFLILNKDFKFRFIKIR